MEKKTKIQEVKKVLMNILEGYYGVNNSIPVNFIHYLMKNIVSFKATENSIKMLCNRARKEIGHNIIGQDWDGRTSVWYLKMKKKPEMIVKPVYDSNDISSIMINNPGIVLMHHYHEKWCTHKDGSEVNCICDPDIVIFRFDPNTNPEIINAVQSAEYSELQEFMDFSESKIYLATLTNNKQ